MQAQQKAISELHRQARSLVGSKVNVKMEGVDYTKELVVKDVKFNRKPIVIGNEISLKCRLRFADMRYSDVTFKTVIQ